MTWLSLMWIVFLTCAFIIPTGMLASGAPKRERFGLRAAGAIVCALIAFGIIDFVSHGAPRPSVFDLTTFLPGSISFAIGIVTLIALVYFCYDLSPWAAAFCGTAGYICQNLGDSLGYLFNLLLPSVSLGQGPISLNDIAASVVTLLVFYLLMVRPVRRFGLTSVDNHRMLFMTVAVIFVSIIAAFALGSLEELGMPIGGLVILRVLHLSASILLLYMEYEMLYHRRMLREIEATEHVLEERSRQYELSRENIDAINVKCHDIRHQIRVLASGAGTVVAPEVLDGITREVNVYDSMVKTGNDALDTILTEKSLVCDAESIGLSCIADGEALGFMAPTDIYAFFGNVLDNAIEAERAVENHNDRSISLVVCETAGMASIHVENYFTGEASFVDGLPVTTKDDKAYHGFGTKSMRLIVERYDGTLSMGTENEVFFVNALIPIRA